ISCTLLPHQSVLFLESKHSVYLADGCRESSSLCQLLVYCRHGRGGRVYRVAGQHTSNQAPSTWVISCPSPSGTAVVMPGRRCFRRLRPPRVKNGLPTLGK